MNRHTPPPLNIRFGVFMCECCDMVITHDYPVVDDFGEMCCPKSAKYLERYYWNHEATQRLKRNFMYRPVCEDEFGWCLECGDSFHPDKWLVDDYGSVVCELDSTPLVTYDIASLDAY